ncbi:unnamed protein product [Ostreobium quekettii]|uniref:Uncharacterized protein n=1 Tax=Ostreobium quekettii TaxID=121088 RepID=A0A8S1IZR7_9CHLO|nr:unnamed protein product [Ostreobium quekettii]
MLDELGISPPQGFAKRLKELKGLIEVSLKDLLPSTPPDEVLAKASEVAVRMMVDDSAQSGALSGMPFVEIPVEGGDQPEGNRAQRDWQDVAETICGDRDATANTIQKVTLLAMDVLNKAGANMLTSDGIGGQLPNVNEAEDFVWQFAPQGKQSDTAPQFKNWQKMAEEHLTLFLALKDPEDRKAFLEERKRKRQDADRSIMDHNLAVESRNRDIARKYMKPSRGVGQKDTNKKKALDALKPSRAARSSALTGASFGPQAPPQQLQPHPAVARAPTSHRASVDRAQSGACGNGHGQACRPGTSASASQRTTASRGRGTGRGRPRSLFPGCQAVSAMDTDSDGCGGDEAFMDGMHLASVSNWDPDIPNFSASRLAAQGESDVTVSDPNRSLGARPRLRCPDEGTSRAHAAASASDRTSLPPKKQAKFRDGSTPGPSNSGPPGPCNSGPPDSQHGYVVVTDIDELRARCGQPSGQRDDSSGRAERPGVRNADTATSPQSRLGPGARGDRRDDEVPSRTCSLGGAQSGPSRGGGGGGEGARRVRVRPGSGRAHPGRGRQAWEAGDREAAPAVKSEPMEGMAGVRVKGEGP